MCTTSAFEWPCPAEARVAAYLAISIHPSLSSLCTTNYRFAKLTFLWWNNGVARANGEEDARRRRGDEWARAHLETREGQFDVNRSIVIRVNRLLPLVVDGPRRPLPNTIHDLYCCTLFPEWSRSATALRLTANIYGRVQVRSQRVTDDETGNLNPRGSEIDIFRVHRQARCAAC